MSDLFVRTAEKRDIPLLAHWITSNPGNMLDTHIFDYPRTLTLVAHRDKPVAFLPVQEVIQMESLAFAPDTTDAQKAYALAQLLRVLVYKAREQNFKEIYFYTADDQLAEFALKHKFEEMPKRTFRLRIADLEQPSDSTVSV